MNFFKAFPNEKRLPGLQRLYGGRWAMSRLVSLGDGSEVKATDLPANGTVHAFEASAAEIAQIEAASIKPTDFHLIDVTTGGDGEEVAALYKWETLTGTFVDEEAPVLDYDLNGLKRITRKLIAKKGTVHSFDQGVSTLDGCTLGQLKDNSTDFAARLTLVFLEPGQIAQSDTFENNDKLHVRTITAFGLVPATPAGFVLVGTQASETEGIPTRVYRYAKGEGEISRDPSSSNNGKLLRVAIRRLSAPGATLVAADFAAGSGYVLVGGPSMQEAAGHRVWSAEFAKGDGVVSRTPGEANNGALLTVAIRALSAPDASNPIAPEATYYALPPAYQEVDGHRVWTQEFVKGAGEISRTPGARYNGALLTLAIRHLSAPSVSASPIDTPSGYVLIEGPSMQEADGHRVWAASFARGTGVISREPGEANNGALLTVAIRALSAPGASNPIAPEATYYAKPATYQESDGHRIWAQEFVKGSGQISYDPSSSNNGRLLRVAIRHLTAPGAANPISTPSGYVLVDGPSSQEADGHRVWSAVFAKGDGEISRDEQGQGDGVVISIRYLSAPAASNPISTPAGFLKVSESYQEADGHRVWSAVYAKGTDVTDYELNGLKRVTRTLFASTGTSTSAFIVGTQTYGAAPTLYLARVRIEDNGIYQRVVAEYLQPGITSREIRLLDGGIKQTTLRAFYTEPTISNAIYVSKTEENENGYRVWQVVGLTKVDGSSLTSGTALTVQTLENFTYPGRAKLFTQTLVVGAVNFNFTDLYLDPPIETVLTATMEISYSNSNTPPTLANPLWAPSQWAALNAVYVIEENLNGARSNVQALRGYLCGGSNPQTVTFNSSLGNAAIAFGTFLETSFKGTATLSGGPALPGGTTKTLRWDVQPAFVGTDGTQYYRRTVVYAAIPAQSDLPV